MLFKKESLTMYSLSINLVLQNEKRKREQMKGFTYYRMFIYLKSIVNCKGKFIKKMPNLKPLIHYLL